MDLVGLGSWQNDTSMPAFTWLDSISLEVGYFELVPLYRGVPAANVEFGSYSDPTKYTVRIDASTPSTLVFA